VTVLGLALTFSTAAPLVAEFLRHRRRPLAAYGWAGLAVLLVAEWLMFHHVEPLATYFTPLAWTCYILLADAAVLAISGRSRLHDEPRSFAKAALLSIPLWLVFEAYNLRLENWTYMGVPSTWAAELVGYGWSFATITPGIFETADLIRAFGWFKPARPIVFSRWAQRAAMLLGLVCLALPLALPKGIASHLFALVWIGFVLLLDPINHRLRLPSLVGDFAAGRRGRFWSLLISGWVCGWLWEFWNYWASAKWHYIFPMAQRWKIFEMPAPGYLGFPPFALECFAMYVTASWIVGLGRGPAK
jgi:hypothetical protein